MSGLIGPLSLIEFYEGFSFLLDAHFWRLLCSEHGFAVG
jgi:hypothetical protein